MMIGLAEGMVAPHFDHAAVRNPTAAALLYPTLQFGLECLKTRNSLLDFHQLFAGDAIRGVARLISSVSKRSENTGPSRKSNE